MKLKEIEIYGYGKWSNIKIDQLADFQCFYGENEAGKSTLMSFIHSMLFGFPTKKGNERSFAPNTEKQYGGKITVTLSDGNEATIERIKGSTPEEVSVVFSSGRSGGEALLAELLQGVDQSLYRAIFSFDLFDIQNVQSFSKEDLGHFLFSSAVVGTDGILKAEQFLNKQLEQRFKPSGTKPVLNRGLKELKNAYEELKKAEKSNNHYKELTEKKEFFIQNNEKLSQEVRALEEKVNALRKWFKIEDVYIKYQSLLVENGRLEVDAFPLDGLNRLEQALQSREVVAEQLNERILKKKALEEKLTNANIHRQLVSERAEIQAVCESNQVRENHVMVIQELQLEIKALDEELQQIFDKLHLQLTEEDILSLDTSMFQKELITNAMKTKTRLLDKKEQMDDESAAVRAELIDLESKIDTGKADLLSTEERVRLSQKIHAYENIESKEHRLSEIQDKIQLLTKKLKLAVADEKKSRKIESMKVSLFSLLFIFIGIGGFLDGSFMIQAIAIGGLGVVIITSLFKKPAAYSNVMKDELALLSKEREELEEKERGDDKSRMNEWRRIVVRDEQQEARINEYNRRMDYVNDQHEKLIAAYEVWEGDMREVDDKIDHLAKQLKLTKSYMKNHLLDVFLLIEEMKRMIRKRKAKKAKVDTLNQSVSQIEEQLSHYFTFLPITPNSYADGVIQLKEAIDEERNKLVNYEKIRELKDSLMEDISILEEKHIKKDKQIQLLLEEAKAESIELFKERGLVAKRKVEIREELRTEELKLNIANLPAELLNEFFETRPAVDAMEAYQTQITNKQNVIAEQQEALQRLSFEIKQLEEGGIYGERLHKYKQLKAEWNGAAKEWAVYATAKRLLSETVNTFKEEEFPKILKKAGGYFCKLTLGAYKQILYDNETNQLLLEDKDGVFFQPRALSQSTAEQLYISLRLSLAEIVFHRYQLPIIIDDGFVNFDRKRVEEMMRVLREKQQQQQIIFFTCHEVMLQSFHQDEVIDVNHLQTATIRK